MVLFKIEVFFFFLVSFRMFHGEFDASKVCVDNNTYCFPHRVWLYWEGFIPEDIEEILNITKSSLLNFTCVFLMEKNISEFLNLEFFPKNYGELWFQGKADYVRVCLLRNFGGIWLDCSVIVNSGREMEWVFSEAVKSKCQFLSFSLGPHKHFLSMPFIAAPENSTFMKKFCADVEKTVSKGVSPSLKEMCPLLRKRGYRGTCGRSRHV